MTLSMGFLTWKIKDYILQCTHPNEKKTGYFLRLEAHYYPKVIKKFLFIYAEVWKMIFGAASNSKRN